jgi:prevent-host-death family protein
MEKIIGITEARTNMKNLVDRVSEQNEIYVIARNSKPQAVIISYEEYIKNIAMLEESKKLRFEKVLEETREQFTQWLKKRGYDIEKLSDEEIERIIASE